MKRAIFGFFVMAFMLVTSCKKSDDAKNSGPATYGTFSFKGTSYTATSCTAAGNYLTATNGSTLTGPNVLLNFPGNAMPTTGGTYIVAQGTFPSGANQVGVEFNPSITSVYAATGGNGNQTVTVTVNAGKVTVVGTGIELVGMTQSDSSALNFNIAQQ